MRTFVTMIAVMALLSPALQGADPMPAGQLVQLDVLIADISGPAAEDMTAARIIEMAQKGQVSSSVQIRLAAIEQQQASAQYGQRAALASGRMDRGGGGAGPFGQGGQAVSYVTENLGTVIQATTKVEQDGAIVAHLTIERTRLTPTKPAADADAAPALVLPRSEQLNTQTTVRLASGKPAIVGSHQTSTGAEATQTYIVLTATTPQPKAAARALPPVELKVVSLTNARASEVARIIAEIFPDLSFRIGVDERINALLISGPATDLDMVLSLITRLDAPK